ncbi:MAG: 50S ribosomal protein L32 [Parachlamydiales bacterium]|nr:50S ribosomal protein L32 [Parachlamydiales bacterium]
MAVPRNRLSNARKNSRRAHHAKKPRFLAKCTNCSAPGLPHRICASCGYYGGKQIIAVQEENA